MILRSPNHPIRPNAFDQSLIYWVKSLSCLSCSGPFPGCLYLGTLPYRLGPLPYRTDFCLPFLHFGIWCVGTLACLLSATRFGPIQHLNLAAAIALPACLFFVFSPLLVSVLQLDYQLDGSDNTWSFCLQGVCVGMGLPKKACRKEKWDYQWPY